MKKIITPILTMTGIFLIFIWLLSTRETTMDITLFGAEHVTLLIAIYLLIPGIGNPDYYRMWWSISDISVVLYSSLPVFIAAVAFCVRRSIVKG